MLSQIPDFFARKLFRSFDTSEAFLDQVAEIRENSGNKKFVFIIFEAGLLELLAIKYFLARRWGDQFVLKRAIGYSSLWVSPFRENLRRLLYFLGFQKFKFSLARACQAELNQGRPILVNLPIGFRAGKITAQEKILEYLIQSEKALVILPVVFIWRRAGRKVEMKDEDLSSRLIRSIKSPLLAPWYLLLGDPTKPLGLRKLLMMLRGYSRSIVRVATVIENTKEKTLQGGEARVHKGFSAREAGHARADIQTDTRNLGTDSAKPRISGVCTAPFARRKYSRRKIIPSRSGDTQRDCCRLFFPCD